MDLASRTIECVARLGGVVPALDGGSPRCSVDGVEIEMLEVSQSGPNITYRATLAGAALWSPEAPNLHELVLDIGPESIRERFGVRSVAAADRRVEINGLAIKLLGYCRHESHPQFGPALPLQQLVQDIQLLKDQGCNFVRGAHYPQDQRFLDLCDEAGLLVFEESLGWQQNESHFADPKYCVACEDQTRMMVQNSINHPSVIMWGFLNEGRSDSTESRDLYTSLAGAIREEDPDRLVTFASSHPMDDRNLDLVDIVCINNYPGWYSRDREVSRPLAEIIPALDQIRGHIRGVKGLSEAPFIVSEIGAGAIYGWRDAHRAHWSEEYQSEYLDVVCGEVVENEDIAGVALWQFCDARTYSSAGALFRPRAFNNKGVLNEYRKPKMAYEVVRSHFTSNWKTT